MSSYEGYGYETYGHDDSYAAADPPPSSDPAAGRGRRRKAAPEPEPEPERHPEAAPHDPPYDPQWEQSGLGWDQEAWNRAQYAADQFQPGADEYPAQHDTRYGTQYKEPVQDFDGVPAPAAPTEFEPEFNSAPERVPTAPTTADDSATTPDTAGRGAFGAAGLAVVTGIAAIAATPVLAVVVGLSQIGLVVGWSRSVGLPNMRRTIVFVAGIGLAAAVLAYRMIPDRAPAAMSAALGVGFVFLAADQLFRKDAAAAWPRSEAFAAAVTGAAFAVLPAGYLVAQRWDSALAGACALAAAVAVLCSALVGGGTRPTGILAGAAAATAVGTLTAVTLNATAGSKGGALGGLMSGVFAVVGARTADRLAAEGGDVRISAQTLPVAFSAIGAAIAAQVLR